MRRLSFTLFKDLFTNVMQMPLNVVQYRKIPKISPGAYIFQRPFLRGLFLEGKLLHVKLILDENPPFSRPILSEEIFLNGTVLT